MKLLSWEITEDQRGKILEQVLRAEYGLSRRQLVRLKKQPGSVLINGQPVRLGTYLSLGDMVKIIMEEHLETLPPEAIELDIIHEDQDLAIVNKPAGMVSHPTKGYASGTLANALSWHWQQREEQHPARLVTRLDKDTSGLVLVAKTAWAHYRLSQTDIHKEYLAITRGIPNPTEGEINLPLGRCAENPNKRGVDPQGKAALTKYKTEKITNNLALVRLWPITGRTHQLRIHMAYIGCSLVDDFMYGIEEGIVGRTALHAHKLQFAHPQTGQRMGFEVSLPMEMSILSE